MAPATNPRNQRQEERGCPIMAALLSLRLACDSSSSRCNSHTATRIQNAQSQSYSGLGTTQ